MLLISTTIVMSALSGIFYRMGGSSKFNTRFRDVGCSLLTCLWLGLFMKWHWTLIPIFGLMWWALSTYWKFGKPDAKWYHWFFTGLGYSLATLPLIFVEGNWLGFLSRTIILSGLTMIWSEYNGNAVREELGRGALIIVTLPLLLI